MDKRLALAKKFHGIGPPSLNTWEEVCEQEEKETRAGAPTGDEEFDRKGYKIVRNICPVELLLDDVPQERGMITYRGNRILYSKPDEAQVPGSVSRYLYPNQQAAFSHIKKKVEESIGQPVYKTYYYDRFYFPGQDLKYHADRPSCEISATVHCSSNLRDKWPICIKSPDGSVGEVYLEPGDGLIYKGCERPHWRLPMSGVKRNKIRKLLGMKEYYYHQIFFHYVLSNGKYSHYAGDEGKNRV